MTDDFTTLKNVDYWYDSNCNICNTPIKGLYKIHQKGDDYFIQVQCPFCEKKRRIIYYDFLIKEQYMRRYGYK